MDVYSLNDNKDHMKGNLNMIKSIYITKKIFSYLIINKKLELIKYNKKLSQSFGYTIDDYKKLCKRYIVFGKNGKGKEYIMNSSKLLFEGEYKNNKRNGKGKEYYDNGNLKFEGEYLNGKIINGKLYDIYNHKLLEIGKNGYGKEYYDNGKCQFIGQYLDGKRWNGKGYNKEGKKEFEIILGNGKGKEYSYYGFIIFEGEYKNGKRDGNGMEYTNNKIIFEGEYKNGKRNGKGREYNGKDYLLSEGIYLNGELYFIVMMDLKNLK